jgi:hypothetical protein
MAGCNAYPLAIAHNGAAPNEALVDPENWWACDNQYNHWYPYHVWKNFSDERIQFRCIFRRVTQEERLLRFDYAI